MEFNITHDMQGTLREILRELIQALGHLNFELKGDTVFVTDGSKSLKVELVYEGERHLGLLDLPMTEVKYAFSGYSVAEKDAFMKHLQQHMQRLGQ